MAVAVFFVRLNEEALSAVHRSKTAPDLTSGGPTDDQCLMAFGQTLHTRISSWKKSLDWSAQARLKYFEAPAGIAPREFVEEFRVTEEFGTKVKRFEVQ